MGRLAIPGGLLFDDCAHLRGGLRLPPWRTRLSLSKARLGLPVQSRGAEECASRDPGSAALHSKNQYASASRNPGTLWSYPLPPLGELHRQWSKRRKPSRSSVHQLNHCGRGLRNVRWRNKEITGAKRAGRQVHVAENWFRHRQGEIFDRDEQKIFPGTLGKQRCGERSQVLSTFMRQGDGEHPKVPYAIFL